MQQGPFTYPRNQKLKSRKLLGNLFATGKSLNAFPLKLVYQTNSPVNAEILMAGVGASSRNFKKAVDRNRIKRLLRESYRLQKNILQDGLPKDRQWQLFFIYTGKELPESKLIAEKMQFLMQKLIDQFGTKTVFDSSSPTPNEGA
jgi:ribonuclease P protein component